VLRPSLGSVGAELFGWGLQVKVAIHRDPVPRSCLAKLLADIATCKKRYSDCPFYSKIRPSEWEENVICCLALFAAHLMLARNDPTPPCWIDG
jgi:hypothetical protein